MSFSYGEITSRKNEKIIWASKLTDKKNRDKEGVFYTEGIKLLDEVIKSGLKVSKVFFTKDALNQFSDTIENAKSREYFLVSDEVYDKLTDETSPQGIFAVVEKRCDLPKHPPIEQGGFIILEDIQNPQNLGAVFRCAYSLGGARLILSNACADVYSPKTLRSGMGSIFKTEFYVCDDIFRIINEIKSHGNRVFCTHLHSDSLKLGSFSFLESDSIVIGNEGHGISEKTVSVCDGSVIIPMTEGAESLNAATASSIIIWEMNKNKLQ